MGTCFHLSIGELTDAIRAPVPNPTLRCENCGADKAPADIALLWVYGPVPDAHDPRLMFICDDCNITLTAHGCRLVTMPEATATYRQQVRDTPDYGRGGTGGG